MKHLFYIFALVFAIGLASCADDKKQPDSNPQKPKDTLQLSESTLGFGRQGATKTFKITTPGKWTAISSATQWCTLSEEQGQGDATISVTALALISDASQRTTTITVTGESGTSQKIEVTQQGLDVKFAVTSKLLVSGSSTTLATILPEHVFPMQISTNAPYTVAVDAGAGEWLEVVDYSPDNQTYENRTVDQLFRAKENTTGAMREGSVTFTYKEMGGIKEHQLKMKVQQSGPSDREALMELYEALGKPEEMLNWGSLLPLNNWQGIKLANSGVSSLSISPDSDKQLSLKDNNQAWQALSKLKGLQGLVIYRCDLTQVPEQINQITNLTDLHIGDSPIATGANLDKLTKVKTLYLEALQLKAFPKEVCALTQLVSLTIESSRGSKIEGELPSEISNMKSLEVLAINDNKLSGQIPASLATMTKLTGLYIEHNQFSGEIPQAVLDCPMFEKWHETEPGMDDGFCNQIGEGFSNCPKEHNK